MAKARETLENMRVKRGALNFDTNEAKILVDKLKGKPVDIVLRQRGVAESAWLITLCWSANETVAEHQQAGFAFIYQIHGS